MYKWWEVGNLSMAIGYCKSNPSIVPAGPSRWQYTTSALRQCKYAWIISLTVCPRLWDGEMVNRTQLKVQYLRHGQNMCILPHHFLPVATILKWELQNLQRHFCTSSTTAHYPRGSSHIVLLQYWNTKPIFWVRISGQSMLPDGCWNYMSKDRSAAKFVTQHHTRNHQNFNLHCTACKVNKRCKVSSQLTQVRVWIIL